MACTGHLSATWSSAGWHSVSHRMLTTCIALGQRRDVGLGPSYATGVHTADNGARMPYSCYPVLHIEAAIFELVDHDQTVPLLLIKHAAVAAWKLSRQRSDRFCGLRENTIVL